MYCSTRYKYNTSSGLYFDKIPSPWNSLNTSFSCLLESKRMKKFMPNFNLCFKRLFVVKKWSELLLPLRDDAAATQILT